MRRTGIITAVATGLGVLLAGQLRAQEGPKSVWDGVYTDAQAERGKAAYTQSCVFSLSWATAARRDATPADARYLASRTVLSP